MTTEETPKAVKKYMSSMGKKSWEAQKKKKNSEFFRAMQKKGVKARNKKKAVDNSVA